MASHIILALFSASVVIAGPTSYRANAICANAQLMRWYEPDIGLWPQPDGGYFWWQAANMISAFNDLALLDSGVKEEFGSVWVNTHSNAPANNPPPPTHFMPGREDRRSEPMDRANYANNNIRQAESGFLNHNYDDEGWWALAWIGAWDNTGNSTYLNEAILIWQDINAAWGVPNCGGIPWSKELGPGALAIQNGSCATLEMQPPLATVIVTNISTELYIQASAALYNRIEGDDATTYLDAALRGWDWFQNSGLINSDNLINDGLNDETCENNGDPTWTYNQGVILGGLTELYHATGNESYLDAAAAIADAVTTAGSSLLDSDGVLVDGCDLDQSCTGDGIQFKGVFTRNLKLLQAVRPKEQWRDFLETNAQSIWTNDLDLVDGECHLGVYWRGPYTTANPSSQSSALDGLNAALAVTS